MKKQSPTCRQSVSRALAFSLFFLFALLHYHVAQHSPVSRRRQNVRMEPHNDMPMEDHLTGFAVGRESERKSDAASTPNKRLSRDLPLTWSYTGLTQASAGPVDSAPPSCSQPSHLHGSLDRSVAIQLNQNYLNATLSHGKKPRVAAIGQVLLDAAQRHSTTLLTLQIGGMDGKTGDPVFRMVSERTELPHWMPIVVEPVQRNFVKLQATYQQHRRNKHVRCPLLLQQAISYTALKTTEAESSTTTRTCPFCYYDAAKPDCQNVPDWIKNEMGSMNCKIFRDRFDGCFVQQDLPCGTVHEALQKYQVPTHAIGVLQIDVEGFESNVIPGFLSALRDDELPPVINFESKVLAQRRELMPLLDLLRSRGYSTHVKRIDTLALLVN